MEKYETIRKLGQGTYGSVYLCRQKASGKQCVMKRLQLNALNEKERRSALQEANLLKRLDHPNVVAYVDMISTRSKLFIFMQYCDGGDLEQRLATCKKEGRHVPEAQLLDWFVQMALALQYLHSQRVLHRDLKTANVFLTRANIVKLGDLGVARVLSATAELAKTFVGTPYYLSPELLQSQPYGPPADVWALGIIVYEIATLEHPFDAKNFPQLADRILRTEPEPIGARRPASVGGDVRSLDAIFRTMIRKPPHQRASLPLLLATPLVQRRMLAFVKEIDPTAPLNAAPSAQPTPTQPAAHAQPRPTAPPSREAGRPSSRPPPAQPAQPATQQPPPFVPPRSRSPQLERPPSQHALSSPAADAGAESSSTRKGGQQRAPSSSSSSAEPHLRRSGDGRADGRDGRDGGEADEERRKAEVLLAAIECEQERLQIALSQLHAAKQLVETQRLTHAPPKYSDAPPPYQDDAPPYHEDALPYHDDLGASYHHPPYDEQQYAEAGYAEDEAAARPAAGRYAAGADEDALNGSLSGVNALSRSLSGVNAPAHVHVAAALEAAAAAAAAAAVAVACAVPWSEPPPYQTPARWEGAAYVAEDTADMADGALPRSWREEGAREYDEEEEAAYAAEAEAALRAEADALAAAEEDGYDAHNDEAEAQAERAELQAAATAAAARYDDLEAVTGARSCGGGYLEGGYHATLRTTSATVGGYRYAPSRGEGTGTHTGTHGDGAYGGDGADGTDEDEGEDGLGGRLVVPATLRLAVMPGFLGAQGNVFSAADLPSPGASPRRRGRTGPYDDDDGEAADAAAGRYSGRAAQEAEEEEEAAAEYYEDDFEDDEDEAGHDETDESDLEAAEDEDEAAHDGAGTSLQATLRTRAPGGGGGGGGEYDSHLDALEAELRQLQLQNDEQAVVQDEVHALSGTLRAVAASLSATSGS